MLKVIVCAGVLLAAAPLAVTAQAQSSSARIVERYRELLEANPTRGTALDRLWKIHQDKSATSELLGNYADDMSFSGRMLFGHFLRKAGEEEAAAEAYREAALEDPENALPHLALADLATSAANDPVTAAKELEKACGLLAVDNPVLPATLMKLGNAWAAAGDPTRAAEAWERTVAIDPSNVQLRIQLAQSYEANDLPGRAASHYEFIIANGSPYERALAYRDLARVRQVLGDEDAAIAALERGIALTAPGNWLREALQTQLIRLHQRFGRTDELERKWHAAVERNPRDLGGYLQLVALYRQLADLTKQREWLERLVAVSPRKLEYKEQLAHVLTQLGEADAAAELYDAILADRPDDMESVLTRADLEIRRGAVRDAQERVEALLAANPDDDTVRAKALAFYARNRLFDALEAHLKEDATEPDGIVALAQFYFDRDRADEAHATLERLIDPEAAQEDRANAHGRLAGIYRERNDLPRAVAAMERAAELQADSAERALALGNLYLSVDEFEKARTAVERAYALAKAEGATSVQAEADKTLFQVFQSEPSRKSKAPPPRRAEVPLLDPMGRINLFTVPHPSASGNRQAAKARGLHEFIVELVREARAEKSTDAWLRVARWQIWARRNDLAMRAANEALRIDPDHIQAREMVVQIAVAHRRPAAAASQLQDLAQLDPANATRYRKQLADLNLAGGDFESAIAILQELADANPGDPDLLSDLALGWQQSGNWDAALAAWRKAYELSTLSQRRGMQPALLRVLDRLGRNEEALGLLREAVDAQEDERARLEVFQDMLSYALTHGLEGTLREDFEARHRRRPNDYFTEMALAQILEAEGQVEESFDLQRAAAFSAPDPLKAFEALAAEAEALGRIDTAIEAQERLIVLRSDESAEALENLAALQERALDIPAATDTWRKLVSHFPRDPEILRRAAAYFELWGFDDEASEALRSARVLEPQDLRGLLQLADLAWRSERAAEALSCYDQILQHAKPEEDGNQGEIVVPNAPDSDQQGYQRDYLRSLRSGTGLVNSDTRRVMHGFWKDASIQPLTDGSYRLAAIRGAASILADETFAAQRAGWLREWDRNREATVSERLWAYYFAGDRNRTLSLLEEWMDAEPENPYTKQAFIWLALEMKGYEALGRWLGESTREPQDRDLVAIALGQYLALNTEVLDPALVDAIFPPTYRLRQMTWQAAVLFANTGHFAEAAKLGERVFADAVTNRASYGTELSRWYLIVGDTGNARRILRDAIRGQTGDTPESPVFEALRRYVLLLTAEERDDFIAEYIADPAHNAEPMHRAISRVLLFGLARDEARVAEALHDLYALHGLVYADDYDGDATYRAWTFLLEMGIHLQQWRLDGLAGALWERALSDPALALLSRRQAADVVREIKVRLAANDLVTRSPIEGSVGLADFLVKSGEDLAPSLASVLESAGYPEYSIRIYRKIWESDPSVLNNLRGLLDACRAANAIGVATDILIDAMPSAMVNSGPRPHVPMRIFRDTVLHFVDFLIGQEEYPEAERLLGAAGNFMRQDSMVLERLARVTMQVGDAAAAERYYRRLLELLPRNGQTRLLLAGILDERGKTAEAIALLQEAQPGPGPQNFDAPLADLYLKDGQIGAARAALRRLMRGNHHDAIPGLAESLSDKGYRLEAQRLLYTIVQRERAEGDAFLWQTKLLEILSPEKEPDLFRRVLAQLREMARRTPEHQPAYFEMLVELIQQERGPLPELQSELADAWAKGSGLYAAGAALVGLAIDRESSRELEHTLGQLLAHPEFDPALLGRLRARLSTAGRHDLAAIVAGRVAERMPLQTEQILAYAQELARAGDTSAASLELQKLAVRAVLEPAFAGLVGEELRKIGDADAAARVFEQATRLDPYAGDYAAFVNYARLLIEERDLETARHVLRYSFRNPANNEVDAIVDLLAASHRLREGDYEIADFQLSPSNLSSFQRAVTDRSMPDQTE